MIYDNFRVTGKGESIWDFSDLMEVALRKKNVQGFDTKRDEVLLSPVPSWERSRTMTAQTLRTRDPASNDRRNHRTFSRKQFATVLLSR